MPRTVSDTVSAVLRMVAGLFPTTESTEDTENIAGMARDSGKPAIVECDAGLLKLVVPIFVYDEFVGAVGACGVLLDDGEADAFMIEKTVGMDEAKIESLSGDIKSITTEEAEALAEYIRGRIDDIIDDFKKR